MLPLSVIGMTCPDSNGCDVFGPLLATGGINLLVMRDFFGPGGFLEERLKDYEYRPSQVRMAEAVQRALEEQNHVIIEAGTGTGKTMAYLLPALLHVATRRR